jgi:hypothetical protein
MEVFRHLVLGKVQGIYSFARTKAVVVVKKEREHKQAIVVPEYVKDLCPTFQHRAPHHMPKIAYAIQQRAICQPRELSHTR